ncbi:hypothetical protein G7083_07205 [Vibrio sp. HDW18]|uniref:hypothetical protein n=1 Tax=Vibrio TaxID=662 RepID=UPI00140C8C1D|nr:MULTISPECIES: hypothetical protein [unclassified Vibrio]QIL85658.1 hypothetical protein G7083_07205 [Vibrio sp. HDW18]
MKNILVVIFMFFLFGCKQNDIVFNVSAQESIRIESMLIDNGIIPKSNKNKDGFTISVSSEDRLRAINLLSFYRMPSESNVTMNDLFPVGELVASPFSEKNRLLFGVSSQLKSSIETIPGVITASVDLSYDSKDKKASVIVVHQESLEVSEDFKESIRSMIVNGFGDVDFANVSVSFYKKSFNPVLLSQKDSNWIYYVFALFLTILLGVLFSNGKFIISKIKDYRVHAKSRKL